MSAQTFNQNVLRKSVVCPFLEVGQAVFMLGLHSRVSNLKIECTGASNIVCTTIRDQVGRKNQLHGFLKDGVSGK